MLNLVALYCTCNCTLVNASWFGIENRLHIWERFAWTHWVVQDNSNQRIGGVMIELVGGVVIGLVAMYLYARNSPKHFMDTQKYIDAIAEKYGLNK